MARKMRTLFLRCDCCGMERSFTPQKPMTKYRCMYCNSYTDIRGRLCLVRMTCKCGKYYTYRTNIPDRMLEIKCMDCGTPNAIEYNSRRDLYESM